MEGYEPLVFRSSERLLAEDLLENIVLEYSPGKRIADFRASCGWLCTAFTWECCVILTRCHRLGCCRRHAGDLGTFLHRFGQHGEHSSSGLKEMITSVLCKAVLTSSYVSLLLAMHSSPWPDLPWVSQ